MKPKISVLTSIYRPGYLDSMTQCLQEQTFKDFEWILVDDLWQQRKDIVRQYVGNSLNLKHIPPREITPYSSIERAQNTGLIHAEGELVYFMADYMYLHPRTLERHWEIYSKYGPRVTISGPLIDAIVASGKSIWTGAEPMLMRIKDDEGNIITVPEHTPPIPFPLKDNFEEPTPDNLISIFREPFKPTWPKTFLPDWRLGAISKFSIDKNLCENDNSDWFWGRNDSAPLEALLDINGLDEAFDGRRGGSDGDMGARLKQYGCRLLVDREVPCYMLPHPVRKRANISEEDRLKRIVERRKVQPIPNDYSLRAEREKLLSQNTQGYEEISHNEESPFNSEYYKVGGGSYSLPYTWEYEQTGARIWAKYIKEVFKPNTVLDFGAAKGFIVRALVEQGIDAKGVDISEYAVKHGDETVRNRLQVADATKGLPFAGGAFDLIFSCHTIEHLLPKDIPKILSELARVAKDWVVVALPVGDDDSTPHRPEPGDYTHQAIFSPSFWIKNAHDAGLFLQLGASRLDITGEPPILPDALLVFRKEDSNERIAPMYFGRDTFQPQPIGKNVLGEVFYLTRRERRNKSSLSKILCISTAIYPVSSELRYGGIERLCYMISNELSRRGFAVSVAAPDGSSFPEGIMHINTGPCGDFIEGEKNAYQHYSHLLGEFDAIISFDHRHFAMLEQNLPSIALIWHTPSIMQFPLPSYNIASLSEFQKRELEQYQGLKSRVIDPHCIDAKAYLPCSSNGRYLFIGRLNPEKGVRDAIKLCRELDVGLDIIGGLGQGDPQEYLQWVESNCDGQQIIYHGSVSDPVKFEFIARAKALLHTVNYAEVSSHKSIEAMCGGLPVVAYDIGANREIIEHEVTGLVARDEREFKEYMLKVETLDRNTVRERAMKRWGVEAMVNRIIPVLEAVAKGERWGNVTKSSTTTSQGPVIIKPSAPSAVGYVKYELQEYPRQIRLDTINICNAKCLPCHLHLQKKKGGRMSIEILPEILRDITSWPQPLQEIVPIGFGELFLRKNWYDILKLIERQLPNTKIALPTNGSLLDDDAVRKVASIRTVKWVNFSINAFFKETYEAFTGLGAETIDRIKSAAELIRSLRPDIVTCASMIFDTNFQTEIERDLFIQFWLPLVSVVSINPAAYCNSPLQKPLIPPKTACRSIFDGLTILWDGKVVTGCCFDASGALEIGDANKQTLLEIWRGERLKELCELHNSGRRGEIELCSRCSFA